MRIFLALIFFSGLAQAGTRDGGGGKVVVCKNPAGEIASVELLDLWEARTIYGMRLLPPTDELYADVQAGLDRLQRLLGSDPDSSKDTKKALEDFAMKFLMSNPNVKMLPGVTLTPTDDSYEVARPSGCEIQQAVTYQDNGYIFVSQDLWMKMDEASMAALIVHESLYALLRARFGESNSIRTRRAVGRMAAGALLEGPTVPPEDAVMYHAVTTAFPQRLTDLVGLATRDRADGMLDLDIYAEVVAGGPLLATSQGPTFTIPVDRRLAQEAMTGRCGDRPIQIGTSFRPVGPIEFDRGIKMAFACSAGVLRLELTNTVPGTETPVTSVLTFGDVGGTSR